MGHLARLRVIGLKCSPACGSLIEDYHFFNQTLPFFVGIQAMENSNIARLKDLPLFDGTEYSALLATKIKPSRRHYSAGQVIVDREEDTRNVFFIIEGCALPVFWMLDGREVIFPRVHAGSCFGELSALDDLPRSLAVYAFQPTDALLVSQDVFLSMIDMLPHFRMRMLRLFAARIRELTRRVYEITGLDVESRVRTYLARMAMDAGVFHTGGALTDVPTHAEIAGSIGANREAVSRAISKLKKSGIIESKRNFIRIKSSEVLIP